LKFERSGVELEVAILGVVETSHKIFPELFMIAEHAELICEAYVALEDAWFKKGAWRARHYWQEDYDENELRVCGNWF